MTKRTGASLIQTVNTASTDTMLNLGLGEKEAARIIRTRRVLPLVDDPKALQIDARKLWEQIGKPHRRFRDWAAHYIKPLMERPDLSAEISAVTTPARGTPRQDYTLSRDIAAHLAMQANTSEGEDIRAYFLDMERLALRLSEHMGIRVDAIVGTDNKLTNTLIKRTAQQAKAAPLPGPSVKAVATDRERLVKAIVCEVLTGHGTAHWRDTFGKGVRDVLDTADALLYSQCLESAWMLIEADIIQDRDKLRAALSKSYGGKVSPAKYAHKVKRQA